MGIGSHNLILENNEILKKIFPRIDELKCGHSEHWVVNNKVDIKKENPKYILKHSYWISLIFVYDQMHKGIFIHYIL